MIRYCSVSLYVTSRVAQSEKLGATVGLGAMGGLLVTAVFVLLSLPWLLISGCDRPATRGPGGQADSQDEKQWQGELYEWAIDNLNRLEEFNSAEMLNQVVERLNQWIQSQEPLEDWKVDPLVATLPKNLAQLPAVKELDRLEFDRYDGLALQEVIWLRDASNWARGEKLDELDQAKSLFDWIIRNIQLEPASFTPDGMPVGQIQQRPWEALLFGRGTATDRAWLFILLARQQGLDAVLLAVPDGDDPSSKRVRVWAPAILSRGELYLFDTSLGLPIPAPDGVKLDEAGQLDVQPATLSQVAGDDALLRKLDVDPTRPYPMRSSDLARVVALLEASPAYLSQRMKLVELPLAAGERMVLTTAASSLAESVKASPHVAGARLWTVPYRTTVQRSQFSQEALRRWLIRFAPFQAVRGGALWRGRILHLKGRFTGEKGATWHYQVARPANEDLAAAVAGTQAAALEAESAAQKAARQAAEKATPRAKKKAAEAAQAAAAARTTAEAAAIDAAMSARGKQDASYWLGLIAFKRGNYGAATDYFVKRTLEASPGGPWTHGAKYNLARTFEATGQFDKAIQQYEADTASPAHRGNLLRARWLKTLHAGDGNPTPSTPPP